MASATDFTRRQYEFAANIRDPDQNPAPDDIEDRRMDIYRELFYNNVESFLSGTFPVLHEILDDSAWHAMVRAYFRDHRSHTPLFLEIPREFLNWLDNERSAQADDLPFLKELAHYEWVELALSISEEKPVLDNIDPAGDLLTGIPVLSPLAWHLAYQYPVHRIGPGFQPESPGEQPTCLVVYRDRNDEVGFLEINPVTKRLLELIDADSDVTGAEILRRIALEMAHPQPDVVVQGGLDIMRSLREREILLGTKP